MWFRVFASAVLFASLGSASAQNGLRGEYFDNDNLTGTRVTRIDPSIDFDWAEGSPIAGIDIDYFSVRWTGEIIPRFSEVYTFYATSDDGVRLWVNGQKILSGWSPRLKTTDVGTIFLKAGNPYTIQLEFFDATVAAVVSLEWSSASQPREIVPASQLRPSPLGTNRPPNVPLLVAPYPDGTTVDAHGFVMKTEPFSDPDTGQFHRCTEWEIWLNDPPELVWSAACAANQNLTSARLQDGQFRNSHTGRTSLVSNQVYTLRVRFRDSSNVPDWEWSVWTERTINTTRALVTLVPQGSIWRYRDLGGSAPTTWRQLSFNDSTWRSGPSQFGFGDGDEATTTCCASGARPTTTYFRKTIQVTNSALVTALTGRLLRDDAAVVYLNNTEVFRSNLPAGVPILYSTLASQSVSEPDEFYNFYEFPISPQFLREGTNCIAVEVHQSSTTSSDLSFDFEMFAEYTASPAPIRISRASAGCVLLSWEDTSVILEAAPDPAGPWTTLSSIAETPFQICDPIAQSCFYRLRRKF